MGSRMKAQLVCDALTMAIWQRQPDKGLIVHSDSNNVNTIFYVLTWLLGSFSYANYMMSEFSPWFRLTFGDIQAEPRARNTVPENLVVAVDLRHPEQAILDEMEQRFFSIVQEGALSHNEAEDAKFEDVEAGCNVLLHAMLKQSYH